MVDPVEEVASTPEGSASLGLEDYKEDTSDLEIVNTAAMIMVLETCETDTNTPGAHKVSASLCCFTQ